MPTSAALQLRRLLTATLIALTLPSNVGADAPPPAPPDAPSLAPPANIKRVIQHGRILRSPATPPVGTNREVAYELGVCHQLDRDHCLLVASMDEQGGGDLCIGNDGFIIQKLSDAGAVQPIPLNRCLKDYEPAPGAEKRFVAKYPAVGFFVPLGALLPDGQPHPAAGTGVLFSCSTTFRADKSTQDEHSHREVEVLQLRWDGQRLEVAHHEIVSKLLDLTLNGSTPIASCAQDVGFLCPFGTIEEGELVYRFDWDGQRWAPTRRSAPFAKTLTEGEASVRPSGDELLVQTRCHGADGHLYAGDGATFRFIATLNTRAGSPKILNAGLDGSLYVACNSSPGWVRNPLEAVPWSDGRFGAPFVLHDQDGVRGDKGASLPFVDHAIASNVFLEGRWRHLIFYRVCDLKERTLHGFQLEQGVGDIVYGKGQGPIPRRPWSGMYAVELEYQSTTRPPYRFAD